MMSRVFWVFGPPLALTAAIVLHPSVDPVWAFMDPIAAAQASATCCSAYYGVMSNIGILYWWAAAAVCMFAAMLLRHRGDAQNARFLLIAGLLSGCLGIDDLLMLHERILPRLGVPQVVVLAALAAAALAYLAAQRHRLFVRDDVVLPLALVFLVSSLLIDVLFRDQPHALAFMEDATKFLGIAGWSAHHLRLALTLASGAPQSRRTATGPLVGKSRVRDEIYLKSNT